MNKQEQKESDDEREACKYGDKCYQKNPEHHKRFRHPPKEKQVKDDNANNSVDSSNSNKRKSPEDDEPESPKAKKQNTSSESEGVQDAEAAVESKAESVDTVMDSKADAEVEEKEEEEPEDKGEQEKKSDDPYAEAKTLIGKLFLVTMPDDFFKLYDFCNDSKPSDPSAALSIAGLKLVGPYDVINGSIAPETSDSNEMLTHWRYYYDPPEFQTVVKGNDKEGLHFGYWRDRPSADPVFVATNCSEVSHKVKPIAENIFGAIVAYLEERLKKANPFEKTGLSNLATKLKAYAKKHNITLETQTPKMKSREKTVVARTIHGAGIVCPYNKKTQVGYRELSVTDNQLLKIIKKIEDAEDDKEREKPRCEVEEVVRLATIAGDECDFGTCLELGHDLLSSGCVHVQNPALAVLSIAYTQLERQAFLKIAEAHMKNRKKGCNVSAITKTSH